MLTLAPQPLQPQDRDCPPPISRTSSSSQSTRTRQDSSYRERERERERDRDSHKPRDRERNHNRDQEQSSSSVPSSTRPRSGPSATRSPTLHPQERPPSEAANARVPLPQQVIPTTDGEKAFLHIHNYPSVELLRLLASLLQEIASSNDRLRSRRNRHTLEEVDPSLVAGPNALQSLTTASRASMSTPNACLQFHARHVPSITLESYFMRILKYCPTSNEVFLSLLVYFDRMSKLSSETTGREFIIDSYNIHRLVIAGVTVASKFFSDVFFTNSRYAKVGGLPQAELNQLELQFLLLNDFNLVISEYEMQRYAVQLIAYAAGMRPSLPPPLSPPRPQVSLAPSADSSRTVAGIMGDSFAARSTTSLASSHTEDTDDEDETIRPPHSSGPSETSSLATADSDAEEEDEVEEDDSDETADSDASSPALRAAASAATSLSSSAAPTTAISARG